MRALLKATLVLLVLPATADADSVSISAPSEGVLGGTTTISVSVEANGPAHNLYVIRKRVDDSPPCGPTISDDYSGGGTRRDIASVQNLQSGTYAYETEWIDQGIKVGEWRICAWLYGPSSSANNTPAPETRISVRAPKATIAIDSAKRRRVYLGHGQLTTSYRVGVSGTREAPARVQGIWKPRGTCPTGSDAVGRAGRPISFTSPLAGGPFVQAALTSGAEVTLGRQYVLCTYVFSPYVSTALAVARRVVEPKTKPLFELPPAVVANQLPVRKLRCDKGFWAAYPRKIRYAFRWYRDGRRLRARGDALRVGRRDRGHRFACDVTARNRVGTSRKRSRAYKIY